MILQIEAGLATFAPALERGKNVGVAAAVEEEALALAQLEEVNTGFEKMIVPGVGDVAFYTESEAGAGSIGKRCDGIAGREDAIGAGALVDRSLQKSRGREGVGPAKDGGVLAQMAPGVAA